MNIVKFFRNTYNGPEYIVDVDGNLKRMKILDKKSIGSFLELSNYFNLVNYISTFLKPERYEIETEKAVLYFSYSGEESVKLEDLSLDLKKELSVLLLNLVQEIYHIPNLYFPVFSVDDILIKGNSFVIQPPIWTKKKEIPDSKENLFIAPEFIKKKEINEKSSIYVIGKVIEKLGIYELKRIVEEMVVEDFTKRSVHFAMPSVFKSFLELNFVVPTIQRPELNELMNVLNLRESVFIGVVGEQRMGKTTLLNLLQERLVSEGKLVIRATGIAQFVLQLLQIAAGKADEDILSQIENIINNGGKVDTLVPLVGSVIDDLEQLFVLVDDYQEKFDNFKVFLKELFSLNFKVKHKVVAFSTEKFSDFDKVIYLKPFSKGQIEELLTKTFFNLERKEVFSDFLYKVSNGYPGILVEVLRTLVEKGLLRKNVEKDSWECELEKLGDFDFENIFDVFDGLNKEYFEKLKYLSVLGQKFTDDEIELLEGVIGWSFSDIIKVAENKGILYREYSNLRFTLRQYWERLYDTVENKKQLHKKLICQYLKLDFFGVYQKVAWHFRMIGDERKALIYYLKSIKRGLEKYYSPNILREMIAEAEKLLPKNKYLYSLIRYKVEIYYRVFREIDFEIPDKKIFEYWKIAAKYVNQKNKEVVEFFEKDKDRLKGFGKFGTYRRVLLYYYALFNLRMYEKIDILTLEKISKIPEVESKFVLELKVRALILLGSIISNRDRVLAEHYYEEAKTIAKEKGLFHFLPTIYNNLSINIGNLVIANQLYDKAIYYSEIIGLTNLSITSKINKIQSMLYMGDINKFFVELLKLRRILELKDLKFELAETYKLEALYHVYNREFEDGLKDIMVARNILEKLQLGSSYLRLLFLLYVFTEKINYVRNMYNENKDARDLKDWGFSYFVKLVFAENDEDFRKIWEEYRDSEVFLWREEIFAIFGEKIAKVDPEGFFEQLRFFEKNYATQGLKLSLAMLYEGFAKYYKTLGKDYRYGLYISKAYSLYREMGFENYVEILEKKEIFKMNPYFKKSLDLTKVYDNKNLSKELRDYFSKTSFAMGILEELKAIEEIEEPQNIVNYFASKILQILPVNGIEIFVKDVQIGQDFKFSSVENVERRDLIEKTL